MDISTFTGLISVENVRAKEVCKCVWVSILIFLWIPIYDVKSQVVTNVMSWIEMSLSVLYQGAQTGYDVWRASNIVVPGVNISIGQTFDVVQEETIYEISEKVLSVIYFLTRATIYIMFWHRRKEIEGTLTVIISELKSTDKQNMRKVSKWLGQKFLFFITFIILIYITLFFAIHRYSWVYIFSIFSRIYSSIIILGVLMVYPYAIEGYEATFKSFFTDNIPPFDRQQFPLIRQRLQHIKHIHNRIERVLGFLGF